MDAFSYLSVLLSIILGLALTQLLQGLRGIALHRTRVRLYLPVLAWATTLMLIFVQTWWAMFGLRRHTEWSFIQFFIVILHTVLLYMLAAIVLPDFRGDDAVDLREHYVAHRLLFSLLLVGAALASLAKDLALDGRLPSATNVAFHVGFMILAGGTMLTRRDAWHHTLSLACLATFICYTALLFGALNRL
jgi:hypothetical protein